MEKGINNKSKKESINSQKYDLEERTALFGERIIEFCKNIPKNIITNELEPISKLRIRFKIKAE